MRQIKMIRYDAIRITIEKDLTKGFDYRLIKVKEGIDV